MISVSLNFYKFKMVIKTFNLEENVYKKFNETYNKGYIELNKKNVIRPILIPPKFSIKR